MKKPPTGFLTEQERRAIEEARDLFEAMYAAPGGNRAHDLINQHTLDMLLLRDSGRCPIGHVAHEEGGLCTSCGPVPAPNTCAPTKHAPGKFDCYTAAHPNEPLFVLLGRDPLAPFVVAVWAKLREMTRGRSEKVESATTCLRAMGAWRRACPTPETIDEDGSALSSFEALVKAPFDFIEVMGQYGDPALPRRGSVTAGDPCEFCGCSSWRVSATLMDCAECGATYGRCNGVWILDPATIRPRG